MNIIKLNIEEIENLILGPCLLPESESAGKHDYHFETYIIEKDNKHYSVTLEYSYNEGLISFDYSDTVDGIEVRPVEVKIIQWEEVE